MGLMEDIIRNVGFTCCRVNPLSFYRAMYPQCLAELAYAAKGCLPLKSLKALARVMAVVDTLLFPLVVVLNIVIMRKYLHEHGSVTVYDRGKQILKKACCAHLQKNLRKGGDVKSWA